MIRSRQGIQFTPEGELLLNYAQSIQKQLKQLREELSQQKDTISGSLAIGVSINYSQFGFPDFLADFCQQYPNVNLNVQTNYSRILFQKLLANELNLAIVRGEFDWKDHKILLKREAICIIRQEKDKDKPLTELPYIGRQTDMIFKREISQWMREHNLNPSAIEYMTVNNISTCVEMVKRGLGWAIVPEICLKDFKGSIEPLYFKNGEPFVRSTYLMYTEQASKLPQIQAFIKSIQEEN